MPILSHEQRIFHLGFSYFNNEGTAFIPELNSYETEIWMRGFKSAEKIEQRRLNAEPWHQWANSEYWLRREAIDSALMEQTG